MPFICLTRSDIPDGIVQILDLAPNESQKNNVLDGPGQTRYINRVQDDQIGLSAAGALTHSLDPSTANIKGLSAYLADVVDPGGTQVATGTAQSVIPVVGDTLDLGGVTLTAVENTCTGTVALGTVVAADTVTLANAVANPLTAVEFASTGVGITPNTVLAADAVTIAGVPFTAQNGGGPNPALQQFDMSAGDQATSDSLVTAINDPASQALITAALDALVAAATGGTLVATNTAGAAIPITLTPSVLGDWGNAAIVQTVGGATLTPVSLTHTDPNPAAQEFGSAAFYEGSADVLTDVATSFVYTANHGATRAQQIAANPGAAPALNGYMIGVVSGTIPGLATFTSSSVGVGGALAMVESTAGVRIVLSGAALVHPAPAAASQEFSSFLDAGTDILVAGTLAATMNDAATDALLVAAGGSTVTAANAGTDTVTMTADTAGSSGALSLVSSAPALIVVSGTHMAKAMETWTAALLNASSTALIAILDTAGALTSTAINAAINGVVGVSGVDVESAGSNASVVGILSILAGRGYEVPVGSSKDTTGFSWDTTAAGAFTEAVQVFGGAMVDGEWNPTHPFVKHAITGRPSVQASGGDTENREYKGIRYTVPSTDFAISMGEGVLSGFAHGVTLFPDSDVAAFVPTFYRPGPQTAQVDNARVVAVYEDDGTLLV